MRAYFTFDELQQATDKGKQAFNNGLPIACPYVGEHYLPLRIRWMAGYDNARKQSESKRG